MDINDNFTAPTVKYDWRVCCGFSCPAAVVDCLSMKSRAATCRDILAPAVTVFRGYLPWYPDQAQTRAYIVGCHHSPQFHHSSGSIAVETRITIMVHAGQSGATGHYARSAQVQQMSRRKRITTLTALCALAGIGAVWTAAEATAAAPPSICSR